MADQPVLDALVRDAAALQLAAVPEPVRDHARRIVADTIGVMLAGAQRSEVIALAESDDVLGARSSGGAQYLVAGLPWADPRDAAFLNATAGTFLELDEGYRPTGHPAMHVVPAALAVAQALHAPGDALLAAVLSGYEVSARLFEAYRLRYPLHPHGHFGAVGAAVAVARLLGHDPAEAAAIASTLPLLSTWEACFEGATTRNAYTGTGAALGITANRLARAGFTGSRNTLDVAFGELAGSIVNPDALAEKVDPANLRITRNYVKFHSACALTHAALDALKSLPKFDPEAIVAIDIETVQNNLKINRPARMNDLSTRFSLPYAVAAAIVHDSTAPAAFVPDARSARLMERVHVRVAADLEAKWPDAAPARVTVRDGSGEHQAIVDNPHGHHSDPATPAEMRDKFVSIVCGPAASALYERLAAIDRVADTAALFEGFE